jgi:hypothetical protein
MSLPRLNVDAVLGNGQICQCRGDWSGTVGRPSPDALSAEFTKRGFESVFRQGEEYECDNTELVGFIRTTRPGLKVVDAYHAIGALGGVDGGVWVSECTEGQFKANLLSRSIGNLIDEIAAAAQSGLEALTGAARFAKWLTDHWLVVLIVALILAALVAVAYVAWKKRGKS